VDAAVFGATEEHVPVIAHETQVGDTRVVGLEVSLSLQRRTSSDGDKSEPEPSNDVRPTHEPVTHGDRIEAVRHCQAGSGVSCHRYEINGLGIVHRILLLINGVHTVDPLETQRLGGNVP